jgi:hypothetical protein
MLKTFAAALIAASMLTAPALAQGTGATKPATEMTKVVKVHKHVRVTKHVRARHHVKHVRHVRHGRHHVRHVNGKRAHAVHVVRHGSKIRAN